MTKTILRFTFAALAGFWSFSNSPVVTPSQAVSGGAVAWEHPPCPPPRGGIIIIRGSESSVGGALAWEQPPGPLPRGNIIIIRASAQTSTLPA